MDESSSEPPWYNGFHLVRRKEPRPLHSEQMLVLTTIVLKTREKGKKCQRGPRNHLTMGYFWYQSPRNLKMFCEPVLYMVSLSTITVPLFHFGSNSLCDMNLHCTNEPRYSWVQPSRDFCHWCHWLKDVSKFYHWNLKIGYFLPKKGGKIDNKKSLLWDTLKNEERSWLPTFVQSGGVGERQ